MRRAWALGVRQMAVPLGGISAGALPALESIGGVRLALLVGAALTCATGTGLALVLGSDARPARRSERAFRSILGAAGMQRLLVVACCYVLVLQALVSYAVPSVRAAGLSAFWASAAYVAINVAAMVSRIVWGRLADRADGARRIRTLVETGGLRPSAPCSSRPPATAARPRSSPRRSCSASARSAGTPSST